MENNEKKDITVYFTDEISVELSSDNPNVEELMKKAIENKENIKLDQIIVECETELFDKEGFKSILISSLESFYSDIKLNKEELKSTMLKSNNKIIE